MTLKFRIIFHFVKILLDIDIAHKFIFVEIPELGLGIKSLVEAPASGPGFREFFV
jgi:hypothetical protein